MKYGVHAPGCAAVLLACQAGSWRAAGGQRGAGATGGCAAAGSSAAAFFSPALTHMCVLCLLARWVSPASEAPGIQLAEFAEAIVKDDLARGIVRDDPVVSSLARASSKHAAPWRQSGIPHAS